VSIFGSIMSKIFGSHGAAAAQAEAPTAQRPSSATTSGGPSPSQGGAGQAAAPQQQQVDIEAVMTGMASQNSQKLDWRHSIVDLMKLLGLDSGLQARRELAQELGYTGDAADSAAMNIWLHKQVMRKLAENGGKVPDELRA